MSTSSKVKNGSSLQNASKSLWKSLMSLSTVFVFVNYFYSVFASAEQITLKSTFLEIVLISFGVLSQAFLFSYKLFPNSDYLKSLIDAEYSTMIFGGLFRKFAKPKAALSRLGSFFVVSLILVGVIYWILLEGGKASGMSYFAFVLSGLLCVCATPNLFFLPVVFSQILVFKSFFLPAVQFGILDAVMIFFFIIQYATLFYCVYGSKMNIFGVKLRSITASKFLALECMKVALIGSAVYAVSPNQPVKIKLDKLDKKDKNQLKKENPKSTSKQGRTRPRGNQRERKNAGGKQALSGQPDTGILGTGNGSAQTSDGSSGLKDKDNKEINRNPGASKSADLADLILDLDTIANLLKNRKFSIPPGDIQDYLNGTANKAKRLGEKYGDRELSNLSRELSSLARSFGVDSLPSLDGIEIPSGNGGGKNGAQGAREGRAKVLSSGTLGDMDPKQMKRVLSKLSSVKRDLSGMKAAARSQQVESERSPGTGLGSGLGSGLGNGSDSMTSRKNVGAGNGSGSSRDPGIEVDVTKSPKSSALGRGSQKRDNIKEKINRKKVQDRKKEDRKKNLSKMIKILLICTGTGVAMYIVYFLFFRKGKEKVIEKSPKKPSAKKLKELARELAVLLDMPYENPLKARLAIIKIYHQVLQMFAERGQAKPTSATADEFYVERVRESAGASYSNLSYITNVFNHVAYSSFAPSHEVFKKYVECAKSLMK